MTIIINTSNLYIDDLYYALSVVYSLCTSDILHVSLSLHNSLMAVAAQISSVKSHLRT